MASDDVLVDYTGGTKVMTSALILASLGHSFRYNYVGGDLRDKNGLGPVINGHEKMFVEMSPWSMFAEEERRQVVTLFNQRRFSAAIGVIDLALDRDLPVRIKRYFKFIRPLAAGFMKWDQFEHKDALSRIKKGLDQLTEYLDEYPDESLCQFKDNVQNCINFLEKLLCETKNLQKPHWVLIDDLMNNARRKIEDQLFDDASARIYRSLELYGQIVFEKALGCYNDKVNPKIIPEQIRDDFVRRYKDANGKLKIPLTATFEILKAKNHEAGLRFFEKQKEIKNIQSNRNYSILAHGIKPVTQKAAESIYQTVSDFVRPEIILDFPKLL
jgi:CRISPR-associated protein (TIGR02710 family)